MIGTISDTIVIMIVIGILVYTHNRNHAAQRSGATAPRRAVEQWGDGPTQSEGGSSPEEQGGQRSRRGGQRSRAEQWGDGPESSGAKSREQWGEVPSMWRAPEGPRSITPGSRPGSCPAVEVLLVSFG